jgi:hypothetical protein
MVKDVRKVCGNRKNACFQVSGISPHPAQNQLAHKNFLAHPHLIQSSGEEYHRM